MRLIVETTSASTAHRWSRYLTEYLTVFVSLLLVAAVAAVAPARSRDRGGSRSAAARASNGSQRWELHDDVCEYPLRVTEADEHASHSVTVVSASNAHDEGRVAEPRDRSTGPLFVLEWGPIQLEPCPCFDEAPLGVERSRAPPISV